MNTDIHGVGRLPTGGFVAAPLVSVALGALVAGSLLGGCASVRFEKGPYVVRDLQVVYSHQEDVTFLSWKLRDDAKVSLVDFQLYRHGGYQSIDLSEAPFPAEPRECVGDRICFQYQVPGRYSAPASRSPVRSRHVDEGIYAGPEPRVREVETTFGIDPIALGHNRRIDPVLDDWFANKRVPLQRDWEWQFVPHSGDECGESGEGWQSMGDTVSVDYGWVDRSVCFAARPDRRDAPGAVVEEPLIPSAETRFTRQKYAPNRIDAPIVYGILVDLLVASESRCEKIKQKLLPAIQDAVEKRGEHRKLGVYTPISAETGQPLSGCDQDPERRYPASKMVRAARNAYAKIEPTRTRIIWIYLNNGPMQPRPELLQQLGRVVVGLPENHDIPVFNWAIGSNPIIGTDAWNHTTGWRPIEDDTFVGDIQSFTEDNLPFATMGHHNGSEIPVEKPRKSREPVAFKICQSSPRPVDALGAESGRPVYSPADPHVPWPPTGRPFFQISLTPQILVPKARYRRVEVDLVVEVCERFCTHPFRTRGGSRYDNWKQTSGDPPMEVCQWQK